ncbi:hypothetical protein C8J57DRAFT_1271889 [Mycena rebaudengoi]|nr:hypothetical protein C8J57DRAFT_1271889 [Mycena rebaudengoi]
MLSILALVFCGGDDPDDEPSAGFHPDSLAGGLFAILCIFALTYSALIIWTFVALIMSRGHRAPYAVLFPTLLFAGWSNAVYMGMILIENIPSLHSFSDSIPDLLLPTMGFVTNLFNYWSLVLLFLTTVLVILNRETALKTASEGKSGGHKPALLAVHIALAALTWIFGTAAEAYILDTNVQFYTGDLARLLFRSRLKHRIMITQALTYVFWSFAVLMGVDVAVSTVLLSRAWRGAEISDKITKVMLYVIVPLWALLSLVNMIFAIIFSPSGLPTNSTLQAYQGAALANSLLAVGLGFGIIITLLFMSAKRTFWTSGGAATHGKYIYAAQPQYMHASPAPAPGGTAQPGFYDPNPQQQQQQTMQSSEGGTVQYRQHEQPHDTSMPQPEPHDMNLQQPHDGNQQYYTTHAS